MSQSASQASVFYAEVAASDVVWTVRDDAGFPAPLTPEGYRSQPFWSSRSRVEKIIRSVPAYADFTPHEISWFDFRERWVPGLTNDGIKVGVNWSGPKATGYDVDAWVVQESVEHRKISSAD